MKAVIFDMDGIISDTQILHSYTESEVLKEHGIELHPDEITRRFAGVSDHEAFPQIFKEAQKELTDLSDFLRRKWERMFAAPAEKIKPMPGTIALISSLSQSNIPLAVASGSSKEFILHVLNTLGIKDKFSTLVSADEVKNGKPAPDIFLLAARQLGYKPQDCVVIEDGLSGMQAAKAAGMRCVALLTHVPEEMSPSEEKVHSMSDITLGMLGFTD